MGGGGNGRLGAGWGQAEVPMVASGWVLSPSCRMPGGQGGVAAVKAGWAVSATQLLNHEVLPLQVWGAGNSRGHSGRLVVQGPAGRRVATRKL